MPPFEVKWPIGTHSDMEKTIRVLNELLEDGVLSDYAIGGAIAATFWAEPVATFASPMPSPRSAQPSKHR